MPLRDFDLIGRFENLDEDFSHVAHRIGQQGGAVAVPRFGPPRTGADQLLTGHYTAADYRKVEQLYAADFEAFGYAKL